MNKKTYSDNYFLLLNELSISLEKETEYISDKNFLRSTFKIFFDPLLKKDDILQMILINRKFKI